MKEIKVEYMVTSTNGTMWANNHVVANTEEFSVDTIQKLQDYLLDVHGQRMVIMSVMKLDDKIKVKQKEVDMAQVEMVRLYHEALRVVKHYARNNFSNSEVAQQFLRENGMGGGDMV